MDLLTLPSTVTEASKRIIPSEMDFAGSIKTNSHTSSLTWRGLDQLTGDRRLYVRRWGKGRRVYRDGLHTGKTAKQTLVLVFGGLVRLTSDAGGGLKEKYNQAIKYED